MIEAGEKIITGEKGKMALKSVESQNIEFKSNCCEANNAASCIHRTAQRDLEYLMEKGIIKAVAKSQTDTTKHYVLL